VPPDPSDPEESLVGPYRVGKPVGMGATANVVEAVHRDTGERVALKILNAEYAGRSDVVSRFVREGRALQNLRHPNIVRVIEHGVSASGDVWIAMERLDAVTLDALIRNRPLPPQRAVKLAVDVASGLAIVHDAGIVHRDVKPDNILVVDAATKMESAKLIDFGVAKMTAAEMGENSIAHTRAGSILGSTAFASPEQLAGEPVDARADVFALAVTLYEALTGELPFDGTTVKAQIEARKAGAIVPLSARNVKDTVFPKALEDFIARSLASERVRRPADGRAMVDELTAILAELESGRGATTSRPRAAKVAHARTPSPPVPAARSKVAIIVFIVALVLGALLLRALLAGN
jgi:serine/threonine-protein kinase